MAGTVAGIVAAIAGIVATVAAVAAWRVSRRELKLAEEAAELRPDLAVSLKEVVFHYQPPDSAAQYKQAALVFDVANRGRSVATNVRCDFHLPLQHLEPDDTHSVNHPFTADRMAPSGSQPHGLNVNVLEFGQTEVYCVCICDEVGKTEGLVTVSVPKPESSS
jgi:hypothetical protein